MNLLKDHPFPPPDGLPVMARLMVYSYKPINKFPPALVVHTYFPVGREIGWLEVRGCFQLAEDYPEDRTYWTLITPPQELLDLEKS